MMDRFQPVAWMIASADGPLSRQRELDAQHRAELRWNDDRPSLASRAADRIRALLVPAPEPTPDPACCTA